MISQKGFPLPWCFLGSSFAGGLKKAVAFVGSAQFLGEHTSSVPAIVVQ